jgi:acylphosphatase
MQTEIWWPTKLTHFQISWIEGWGPTNESRAMPPQVHHERVFFSGRVQGVGFRYAALQVAREYEVSGFVANLPDGRVQLEAEGRAGEVEAFVTALVEKMQGYVRKVERSTGQRAAQFEGFIIDSGFR